MMVLPLPKLLPLPSPRRSDPFATTTAHSPMKIRPHDNSNSQSLDPPVGIDGGTLFFMGVRMGGNRKKSSYNPHEASDTKDTASANRPYYGLFFRLSPPIDFQFSLYSSNQAVSNCFTQAQNPMGGTTGAAKSIKMTTRTANEADLPSVRHETQRRHHEGRAAIALGMVAPRDRGVSSRGASPPHCAASRHSGTALGSR